MAEKILNRAVRGLSGALGLGSGRTGPPGVELGPGSVTTVDLADFARWGVSPGNVRSTDGWVTLAIDDTLAGAGASTLNVEWDTQTGIQVTSPDQWIAYIYGISALVVLSGGAVAGDMQSMSATCDVSDLAGTGARSAHDLVNGDSSGLIAHNAAVTQMRQVFNLQNILQHRPFPWGVQQTLQLKQINTGAGTFEVRWGMLIRLLPLGVPPVM